MTENWRPRASQAALAARAEMLAATRHFFAQREVLEVETPLLSHAAASDEHLHSFEVEGQYYLHTSPEFAMKRLLAAGSGPIYQICKVFRGGEAGERHNPEFSMLEWYRPGFSFDQLVAETQELVDVLLGPQSWKVASYRQVFAEHWGLDPHSATDAELAQVGTHAAGGELGDMARADWLDLLMSARVEPALVGAHVVTDFPACRAALSSIELGSQGVAVSRRFEIYINGLEIANGYLELLDAGELAQRMENDVARRHQLGLKVPPRDTNLLAAMKRE